MEDEIVKIFCVDIKINEEEDEAAYQKIRSGKRLPRDDRAEREREREREIPLKVEYVELI